ncbi:hypothetical protein LWI29_007760 [Acer saccharum]|uniref:MULE transposase domain-containing protein n=1 Tax=Acer saccharum TaxID=4024 RepID=A0AA39T5H7_ACESA|nr:hypothetical protein LWI29_007760 [Acer saccharum]
MLTTVHRFIGPEAVGYGYLGPNGEESRIRSFVEETKWVFDLYVGGRRNVGRNPAVFGLNLKCYLTDRRSSSVAQNRSPLAVRRQDRDRRSRSPLAVLGAAGPPPTDPPTRFCFQLQNPGRFPVVERQWKTACKTENESCSEDEDPIKYSVLPLLPTDPELAASFAERKRSPSPSVAQSRSSSLAVATLAVEIADSCCPSPRRDRRPSVLLALTVGAAHPHRPSVLLTLRRSTRQPGSVFNYKTQGSGHRFRSSQRGIISAMKKVFPDAQHAFCVFHIAQKFRRLSKNRSLAREFFYNAYYKHRRDECDIDLQQMATCNQRCFDSLKDLLDVTIEYKKVVERNEARSRSRSTVVESHIAELERDVYRLKNTKSTSLIDCLRRQEGCTLFKNRHSGSMH